MSTVLSRYQRRVLLERVHTHLHETEWGLMELLGAADTEYAFQEPAWQEGPQGARHRAASEEYRLALSVLRGLTLPDVGELG